MHPVNDKILVRCDINQKHSITIGDIVFQTANEWQTNYRERSPVICEIVEGNDIVFKGDIILCHHNTFYSPSPYLVEDDLFSIPANGNILFAKILKDGSLYPICGNFFIERIVKPSFLDVPPELQEKYDNKFIVTDGGLTPYKKGWIVFGQPSSYYEIVYVVNSIEKRIFKTHKDKVVGYKKLAD